MVPLEADAVWLGQFLLRGPFLPHSQHCHSLFWTSSASLGGCPCRSYLQLFYFFTNCCMACMSVVNIFSIGLETTSSSFSSICFTLVLDHRLPPDLICRNLFPARTASLTVRVWTAERCVASAVAVACVPTY